MSLKSEIIHTSASVSGSMRPGDEHLPRSLRLRLMLWYGVLIAISLSIFAGLILYFTSQAVQANIDSTLQLQGLIIQREVEKQLSTTPPYWPKSFANFTGVYADQGLFIEIKDQNLAIVYPSTLGDVTVPDADIRAVMMVQSKGTGQDKDIDAVVKNTKNPVKVRLFPIRAPVEDGEGHVSNTGPVIGVLLVIKSMEEYDRIFLLLQTLCLVSGLLALVGALAACWAITANVLRPLREIVQTARSIAKTAHGTYIGNLSQRVRRPRGRDEMAEVVDTFNEMLASLEKATVAQRRFIADASHELRAPLTTIRGNLAFLEHHGNELPAEERRTMLRDAHEETLRLAQLVDELLLLARADADQVTSPPSSIAQTATNDVVVAAPSRRDLVEVDHTLLQLVRQLRGRITLDGSHVKLEIGHIEPVRIRGDEESLRRVMLILLDNAIKYSSAKNENDGKVIVSVTRKEDEALFRVQDNGIGIDSADLPYIFERFYRADQARSREGTGLGLSIAQLLVDQLGGRITVESTPGQGSTFNVWLPLEAGKKRSDELPL